MLRPSGAGHGSGRRALASTTKPLEVRWILTFDGSILSNPGGAIGYGWSLSDAGKEIAAGYGYKPSTDGNTVNIAEYLGLVAGLEQAVERAISGTHVRIRGDSQLVIQQCRGTWQTRGHLIPFRNQVHDLCDQLIRKGGGVTFEWYPRDNNVRADELSKMGSATRGLEPLYRVLTPP